MDPQPVLPLYGVELFAREQHVADPKSVVDILAAWEKLDADERSKYEERGQQGMRVYEEATEMWKDKCGNKWSKRMRTVTDKGALSAKVVGYEMRKFPANAQAPAVRAVASASEMLLATLARECFARKSDPTDNVIRLVDVHRLIHTEDRLFGFLADDFADPATLEGYVDDAQVPVVTQQQAPLTALETDRKQPSMEAAQKTYKLAKMPHRPRLAYPSVVKMYDAENPDGPAWDKQMEKDKYQDKYRKLKADYLMAEEAWQLNFPHEYQELLNKRKADRDRNRARKERVTENSSVEMNHVADGSSGCAFEGHSESNALSNMGLLSAAADQQQEAMLLTSRVGISSFSQVSGNEKPQPVTYLLTPQHTSPSLAMNPHPMLTSPFVAPISSPPPVTRRVKEHSEEPNLPPPWKVVQVMDVNGKVEDEYFWNTETDVTSWDRPM